MLDASMLMAAGARTSKNELISGLLDEVNTYNAIVSPTNTQPKADQLLRVCQVGSWYCTSKPPQPPKAHKPGGGKNGIRWAAIKDLLEQVGREVDTLNLRMLRGPSDFKSVSGTSHAHQSYWLELADPQHRPGFMLSEPFARWLKDHHAITNKISFWDHIGTDYRGKASDAVVKYYPQLGTQKYGKYEDRGLLHFDRAGLLCDWFDDPWDTYEDCETHFSGKGWGIFVVSPSLDIYGGSHKAGKHHHSSFLGGGFVMAAGEMACFDGIPRFITAKSGHYAPAAKNLRNFVQRCPQIRGDALIMPGFGQPKFYTVQDFRANGEAGATALTKAQVTTLTIHHKAASTSSPMGSEGFKTVWNKLV